MKNPEVIVAWLISLVILFTSFWLQECPPNKKMFYDLIQANNVTQFDYYLNKCGKRIPITAYQYTRGETPEGALDYAWTVNNLHMIKRLVLEHDAYMYHILNARLPNFQPDRIQAIKFLVAHKRMNVPMMTSDMAMPDIRFLLDLEWKQSRSLPNLAHSLVRFAKASKLREFEELTSVYYEGRQFEELVVMLVVEDLVEALGPLVIQDLDAPVVGMRRLEPMSTVFYMPLSLPDCQNTMNIHCRRDGGQDLTVCEAAAILKRTKIQQSSYCNVFYISV